MVMALGSCVKWPLGYILGTFYHFGNPNVLPMFYVPKLNGNKAATVDLLHKIVPIPTMSTPNLFEGHLNGQIYQRK